MEQRYVCLRGLGSFLVCKEVELGCHFQEPMSFNVDLYYCNLSL